MSVFGFKRDRDRERERKREREKNLRKKYEVNFDTFV